MRYITNADGHVVTVSFGADVECDWGGCLEYTGAVPSGYTSLDDWYVEEAEKLCRWKVVDGNLTLVADAVIPKDKTILDLIYPVGSIYMSVDPTSPADLFGGTWERIEDTFLLAAGYEYLAGTTGGEAEHTLTVGELPEHTHELTDDGNLGLRGVDGQVERFHVSAGSDYYAFAASNMDGLVYDGNVASTGSGEAHNNMPPYLAVYMWKRVESGEPGEIGGLMVNDDGAGNVAVRSYGTAVIEDDGAGNVAIVDSGTTVIEDDGAGNVSVMSTRSTSATGEGMELKSLTLNGVKYDRFPPIEAYIRDYVEQYISEALGGDY